MRIYISILISFLLPLTANSQYQELKKDKKITWIAEFEMELSFDLDQTSANQNEVILKKFMQPKGGDAVKNGNWLTHYLYSHIIKGEVLAYKTSDLKSPYTIDEILRKTSKVDTVITFDPATSIEKKIVVKNELDPGSIKTFKTKQAIYLSNEAGRLGTCLIAIAPLLSNSGTQENPAQKEPMAWIKMDDFYGSLVNENLPAVTWAATINTKATPLDFSQLNVVKGGLDFRKFIYDGAIKGLWKVEDARPGYNSAQYLTKDAISAIYQERVDTVVTFDPTTYMESVHVVKNDVKPKSINNCRLVQDWYYLPEKRMLVNRLRSVAPLVSVTDPNGEIAYYRALYYIRY